MAIANISKTRLEAWANRDCQTKCLDIIDFFSPMTSEEIAAILDKNTTLGMLGISASNCDRGVRRLINRKIRIPAQKPRLPRGSTTTATKVEELIKGSC